MRKKIFLVIVSMVACLLAACTATNSDANNSSMSQEASMSKGEALTEAELITDNNRGLIGTVITNTETAEAHSPDYNESNEQGEEATATIPENTIITDVKENVLIPAVITVFIAEDNTTPEVIMPNGSCAVFAPSVGAKGWICQKGDVLHFAFEKYTSEVSNEQPMVVGVVYNGTMLEGETINDMQGEYVYTADDQGSYAVYVISATSDYLSLKEGEVSIK